jgi:hypothetical protein
MAKRFYISKVIGDGTEENPFRPKVADYPVTWMGMFSHPAVRAWALVKVDAVDHADLIADTQIRPIPEGSLDKTVGSLPAAVKKKLNDYLTENGIDTSWVKNTMTIREVVRNLGQMHDSRFEETKFGGQD